VPAIGLIILGLNVISGVKAAAVVTLKTHVEITCRVIGFPVIIDSPEGLHPYPGGAIGRAVRVMAVGALPRLSGNPRKFGTGIHTGYQAVFGILKCPQSRIPVVRAGPGMAFVALALVVSCYNGRVVIGVRSQQLHLPGAVGLVAPHTPDIGAGIRFKRGHSVNGKGRVVMSRSIGGVRGRVQRPDRPLRVLMTTETEAVAPMYRRVSLALEQPRPMNIIAGSVFAAVMRIMAIGALLGAFRDRVITGSVRSCCAKLAADIILALPPRIVAQVA